MLFFDSTHCNIFQSVVNSDAHDIAFEKVCAKTSALVHANILAVKYPLQ